MIAAEMLSTFDQSHGNVWISALQGKGDEAARQTAAGYRHIASQNTRHQRALGGLSDESNLSAEYAEKGAGGTRRQVVS